MRELLSETNSAVYKNYTLNLETPVTNQATFVNQSIKSHGPKIWNSLPLNLKSS